MLCWNAFCSFLVCRLYIIWLASVFVYTLIVCYALHPMALICTPAHFIFVLHIYVTIFNWTAGSLFYGPALWVFGIAPDESTESAAGAQSEPES